MLSKALLLAGKESTFTIRISASDENGYYSVFSGVLTYGKWAVISMEGATNAPFEGVGYLDIYNGTINFSVQSSTYQVYKLTVEKNSEIVKTVSNSTSINADMALEPGDAVDIRIRTNSSG